MSSPILEASPGERTRGLQPGDLPGVVALYRTINEGVRRRPPEEVARKLGDVFLGQPDVIDGPRSMVHEDRSGAIVGFMGAVPRRWRNGEHTLVGVSLTGFVVDPERRDGLLSARLTKAAVSQGQDFSLADRPTETARKIFAALGARDAPAYGLGWRIALRTAEHARYRLRERWQHDRAWAVLGPVQHALAPVASVLDDRRARRRHADPPAVEISRANVDELHAAQSAVAEAWPLALHEGRATVAWQHDYLVDYPSRGELRSHVVRRGDAILGWFLYYSRVGEPSEVVAFAATPRHRRDVVQALVHTARADGCIGLFGVCSAAFVHELVDAGAAVVGTERLMVSSRRDAVRAAFQGAEALMSGLEAEVWV